MRIHLELYCYKYETHDDNDDGEDDTWPVDQQLQQAVAPVMERRFAVIARRRALIAMSPGRAARPALSGLTVRGGRRPD